jgi:hypothetical protein
MVTPSADGGAGDQGLSPGGRKILEDAGLAPQPGTGQGAKGPGDVQSPSELTVDFDGVQRNVKVDELTAAFREREQTKALQAAVEAKLRQHGDIEALTGLRRVIDEMTPTQKAKMQAYLQNPDLLNDDRQTETDDDDVDAADRVVQRMTGKTNGQKAPAGLPPEFRDEWEQMKQAMGLLIGAETQRVQTGRKQSLSDQVDKAMKEYPLFQEDPVAASFARRAILAEYQTDPEAGLDKLVTSAARELHKMKTASQQQLLEDVGFERPSALPPPPKGGFRGKHSLENGGPRAAALRALSGL